MVTKCIMSIEDQKMLKRGYFDAKFLSDPRFDNKVYVRAFNQCKRRLVRAKKTGLIVVGGGK